MTNWSDPATRVRRDCTHDRRHQHGTRAAYVADGCRCPDCTTDMREYGRTRRRAAAYRRPLHVNAAPTRARLFELVAAGMNLDHIATLTGRTDSGLRAILTGQVDMVRRATETAVLAIEPADARIEHLTNGLIPAIGASRRLHALGAIGWSQRQLAAHTGLHINAIVKIANRRTDTVRVANYRRIVATYDELWDTPPPASTHADATRVGRVLAHARARGWPPPMAWDDELIDDPAHRPSGHRAAA